MLNLVRKHLHVIIILILVLSFGFHYLWRLEFNIGYTPDQPIPFSHKQHAGDYKMDCLYCHSGAEKGPHATIPPMNVCMGCHSVIAVNKENIQNLTKIYDSGKPIEWVRVHRLPDHVYFPHNMHVRAGLECRECHGAVDSMAVIGQVNRLEMGNCLECHRRTNFSDRYLAALDTLPGGIYAAGVYKAYPYMKYLSRPTLQSAERTGALPDAPSAPSHQAVGVFPEQNAMTQCSTCHQ